VGGRSITVGGRSITVGGDSSACKPSLTCMGDAACLLCMLGAVTSINAAVRLASCSASCAVAAAQQCLQAIATSRPYHY
jgi:hypothetical protein